ncbi:telomere-binding alpha subunit central domain-containing protein [Apiospora arundinis]
MYHALDKDSLPEADVFEQQANTSLNIKEKFSLLKDVGDGGFYDLIVEVVKDPYDLVDRVTLWVTDYTENKYFFHHSWDPSNADSGRDGDPYGYTSGFGNPTTKGWPGPYGKQCIQLTCFEPHASHLRSHVRAGKWIRLRNLQIKFGRNGGNLEGYLREDRAYPSRLGFEVLDLSAFSEDGDPRAKDAVRRKLEYSRKLKQQKADFANREDISAVGVKRKGNGESAARLNSRQKRKILRAQRDQQIEKEQAQKAESLGLNKQVRCESEDQPVSSLSRVLNDVSWKRSRENGEEDLALPFTNIKFRANVRVIDFRPRRLEDFSVGRRATEFDCLDDYDGDLESDSDGQSETLDKFAAPKTWEWRFALQLEDASPKAKGEKAEQVWALVDNTEAQQLLNLDAVERIRKGCRSFARHSSSYGATWKSAKDKNLTPLSNPVSNASDNEVEQDGPKLAGHRTLAKVSNKPFTCCLQQYGLEIDESDPTKCDAGVGKRYQRLHKIFGTTVSMIDISKGLTS